MRIHIQMSLRFITKDLHLVLVQAFVRTELQLCDAILEVYVADGMSHMAAPVARFSPLERSSATL